MHIGAINLNEIVLDVRAGTVHLKGDDKRRKTDNSRHIKNNVVNSEVPCVR